MFFLCLFFSLFKKKKLVNLVKYLVQNIIKNKANSIRTPKLIQGTLEGTATNLLHF